MSAPAPTTKDAVEASNPSQCPHALDRLPASSSSAALASGMAISSQEASIIWVTPG